MKRNIIVTMLLAIASVVVAQPKEGTFSIIPRIGVSISTLTKDNVYSVGENGKTVELSSKWKTGMLAGVDFDYQVLPQVSLSAGVYYSEQGCKYDNGQVDGTTLSLKTGTHTGLSNMQTNLKYINVPVLLNMYAAKNFAFKAGVQMGFNVSGKFDITETEYTVNEDGTVEYQKPVTTKVDCDMRKFDLSIPVGLSYEYMNVIVEARYNIGLTRTDKLLGSNAPKNSAINISAAYRFTL